jgi:hypothetical protein
MYSGGGFWIHVTAVYNSTYLESNYNDSAYCEGFAIGIEEMKPLQISLYPNPATHTLTITTEYKIQEISIYNLTGQCVLQQRPSSNVIDVSELKDGLYVIECLVENKMYRQKLIIRR